MGIKARTRDFFDRHVTKLIVDKYGLEERVALKEFLQSESYRMLLDKTLQIYVMSPIAVFDMWESEKVTGNPRNSVYIRA
jgi:hypothetical protein